MLKNSDWCALDQGVYDTARNCKAVRRGVEGFLAGEKLKRKEETDKPAGRKERAPKNLEVTEEQPKDDIKL